MLYCKLRKKIIKKISISTTITFLKMAWVHVFFYQIVSSCRKHTIIKFFMVECQFSLIAEDFKYNSKYTIFHKDINKPWNIVFLKALSPKDENKIQNGQMDNLSIKSVLKCIFALRRSFLKNIFNIVCFRRIIFNFANKAWKMMFHHKEFVYYVHSKW